ncbi:hypothetical protein Q1695_000521 [Nippostrongylus brasiliensis]|nr:hypothetical protein Q1695_000521 [Nippostrongylus brasiliensis]
MGMVKDGDGDHHDDNDDGLKEGATASRPVQTVGMVVSSEQNKRRSVRSQSSVCYGSRERRQSRQVTNSQCQPSCGCEEDRRQSLNSCWPNDKDTGMSSPCSTSFLAAVQASSIEEHR